MPLHIQPSFTVKEMLDRVLRLPAVASKRYLTNKVVNKLEGFENELLWPCSFFHSLPFCGL